MILDFARTLRSQGARVGLGVWDHMTLEFHACSDTLPRRQRAIDRLRQILPDWRGRPTPVYALTETRLLPAKTQRFIEFLQEHLGPRLETTRS